jgi:hypothetical protein
MSSSCYASAANLSTSATEMAFNGNDAVGVQNNLLISLVHSMVELPISQLMKPSEENCGAFNHFNKATQWDVFALDTCNNLGVVCLQGSQNYS